MLPTENTNVIKSTKIDPITVVQDTIDSLSLSLFEGLRGLRDAVAPDSSYQQQQEAAAAAAGDGQEGIGPGGLPIDAAAAVNAANKTDHEPDYDDFLLAFDNDEPYALELVSKAEGKPPRNKEEYIKLRNKIEVDNHNALVTKLAEEILSKSAAVDDLVANLPGMDKTMGQQMERIEELLKENKAVDEELKTACLEAGRRRDEVRSKLESVTCDMLGIKEEK